MRTLSRRWAKTSCCQGTSFAILLWRVAPALLLDRAQARHGSFLPAPHPPCCLRSDGECQGGCEANGRGRSTAALLMAVRPRSRGFLWFSLTGLVLGVLGRTLVGLSWARFPAAPAACLCQEFSTDSSLPLRDRRETRCCLMSGLAKMERKWKEVSQSQNPGPEGTYGFLSH